jgi:hypothetical protein
LLKKFLLFIIVLSLFSCNQEKMKGEGDVLAKVGDNYLYTSDIQGVIPVGSGKKDSAEILRNYINNWIDQRLIVIQAEKFLNNADKNFSKELEEYRNSLIVYAYEKQLVEQKLDTSVNLKEITDYYNKNQQNFQLKENIVKVLYVKLQVKDANISKVRSLLKSKREGDIEKLAGFVGNIAVNSYLDDQNWLFFNDLLKEIPIETYDQEAYLQNHRFIEINDDQYTYLVNFKDFKIKESLSPLSFEIENIRIIILNKRKLKLIEDMRKEVLEKARKNKDFEIF